MRIERSLERRARRRFRGDRGLGGGMCAAPLEMGQLIKEVDLKEMESNADVGDFMFGEIVGGGLYSLFLRVSRTGMPRYAAGDKY